MVAIKEEMTRFVKQRLRRLGYRVSRVDDCDVLGFLVARILARQHELTIVQVGANDGRMNDPIYDLVQSYGPRVRGYVLEPVSRYFEELCRTYRKYPGIVPLNLAIHRTRSRMSIHWIDETIARRRPEYVKGIASFDPEHSRKHGIPDEAVVSEEVDCATLDGLIECYAITNIDLLQVDAEGYDLEVVSSIDLDALEPTIIRFEHGRLKSLERQAFLDIVEHLHAHGYELMIEPRDVTAYKPSLLIPRISG